MDDFLSAKASLRSFGPEVDVDVKRYIEACQHWPVGNLVWSFETLKYFGARRNQILHTRIVPLNPLERLTGLDALRHQLTRMAKQCIASYFALLEYAQPDTSRQGAW